MEACVNNNKAKPQQLELAFLTLRVDYANQHRKDAGSGISHYIYIYMYIYICFNRFNFLFKGCNEEYVYLKDPITESVCC